jgi:predicted TPR repeat methyltransferase
MLAKAAEKGVYDHLGQADLSLEPLLSGVFDAGLAPGRADLITAADVLMYLGDLHGVMAITRMLAADNAVFAFSVEDAEHPEGYVLRHSLRFAHSEAYVREVLADHGFAVQDLARSIIRMDAGKPVHGILFITRKSA